MLLVDLAKRDLQVSHHRLRSCRAGANPLNPAQLTAFGVPNVFVSGALLSVSAVLTDTERIVPELLAVLRSDGTRCALLVYNDFTASATSAHPSDGRICDTGDLTVAGVRVWLWLP